MDFSDLLTHIIENYGYLAIFIAMMLEGFCIPVPSELVMGFAGFLVFQGKLSFTKAVLAGWLGSLTGSSLIYAVARQGGRKFLYKWGYAVRLTPRRLDTIGFWFNRYGSVLIIPWRQLPVIRTKISIAAGLLDMHPATFFKHTALGIAMWCTLSVSLGQYFGQKWPALLEFFTRLGHYIIIAIIAAVIGLGYMLYARRKVKQEPS